MKKSVFNLCLLVMVLLVNISYAQQAHLPVTAYIAWDDDALTKPLSPDVINCYDKIDELVLAFFNPGKKDDSMIDTSLTPMPAIRAIIARAHKNPAHRVKVLISIGGNNPRHLDHLIRLITPDQRDSYIQAINKFLKDNELDGVDMDFESPDLVKHNYREFLCAFKQAWKADNLKMELTVAVGSDLFRDNHVPHNALDSVDFVNAMSYDEWKNNSKKQGASFDYAKQDLDYWLHDFNVPPSKLNLGLPFYGFIDKTTTKPFFTIIQTYNGDKTADSVRPADGHPDTLFYNGTNTIRQKATLAKSSGIHGLMIWEIIFDKDNILLNAAIEGLEAQK